MKDLSKKEKVQIQIAATAMNLNLALMNHKSPVLFWSGGRDSSLLLFLILGILPSIPVIQFRTDWRKEQKVYSDDLIAEKDLSVISFQPVDRSVLPSGENFVLVDDYLINGERFPVIRDIVHSDDFCTLDYSKKTTNDFPFVYDLAIVGWKKSDKQEVLGETVLPRNIRVGTTDFFAPLFDYTDEEVQAMCDELKIKLSGFYADGDERKDTGNFVGCCNCFKDEEKVFCPKEQKEIHSHKWNKEAALKAFQSRFVEV